jgi:hypothetical protein
MSEETTYTTSADGGSAFENVRAELGSSGLSFHDPANWASAEDRIQALHREINSRLPSESNLDPVTEAQLYVQAVQAVPALHLSMQQLFPGAMQTLQRDLEALSSAPAVERRNRATQVSQNIQNLAKDAHITLAAAENRATIATVSRTLSDLGYLVEKRSQQLVATSGAQCIWATMGGQGRLNLDYSGFSGMSCLKEKGRVESALEKRGMRIREYAANSHGNPKGGILAAKMQSVFPQFRFHDRQKSAPSCAKDRVRQA